MIVDRLAAAQLEALQVALGAAHDSGAVTLAANRDDVLRLLDMLSPAPGRLESFRAKLAEVAAAPVDGYLVALVREDDEGALTAGDLFAFRMPGHESTVVVASVFNAGDYKDFVRSIRQ